MAVADTESELNELLISNLREPSASSSLYKDCLLGAGSVEKAQSGSQSILHPSSVYKPICLMSLK